METLHPSLSPCSMYKLGGAYPSGVKSGGDYKNEKEKGHSKKMCNLSIRSKKDLGVKKTQLVRDMRSKTTTAPLPFVKKSVTGEREQGQLTIECEAGEKKGVESGWVRCHIISDMLGRTEEKVDHAGGLGRGRNLQK